MAYKTQFSLFALLVLLAISAKACAGRHIPNNFKDVDVKQPDFLIKSDHSVLIPGIGRVLVPPVFHIPTYNPYTGSSSYLPGGDDTFVPNPGFEVPNPAYVGGNPAPIRP